MDIMCKRFITRLRFSSLSFEARIILLSLFFLVPTYAIPELEMSVIKRNITAYENFLNEKNQSVFEVDNLVSEFANRNVADMVIIMQALNLGGYKSKLVMVEAPNFERELKLLQKGEVVIMHQEIWDDDIDEHQDVLFRSEVIIAEGEFIKGIYTVEENDDVLSIKKRKDVSLFSAVSNKKWRADWEILEKLNLRQLISVSKREYMVNLAGFRGVDFLLLPFSATPDLSYSFNGLKLVPVQGIKVVFSGSRSFALSKKHSSGKQVYEAIQNGLKIMKKKGTIKRYLVESGFFNKQTEDWSIIK